MSGMTLSHFSHKPIERLRFVHQDGPDLLRKPAGLWVSVDGPDDWPTWCEGEGFDGGWEYHYRVTLTKPEEILLIRTTLDLLAFTERYDIPQRQWPKRGSCIDWAKVAGESSGIIIAPYQWRCRLDERTVWYYGWDCASGCIWDPSAISLELDKETRQ